MNKQLVVGGLVGALAVTAIGAYASYRMSDKANYAEVISAKATTKSVRVPREECRDEVVTLTRSTKDPHQIAGTVAGAVVGGVLGNQVGDGRGQQVATVGGAAAGAYAGNKIQEGMQERNTYQETQHKCETVHDSQQQQSGYDVTYRLDGQEHLVHLDYDPGNRIPVENGELVLRK
jgi:uncharacterized protein YcfJ